MRYLLTRLLLIPVMLIVWLFSVLAMALGALLMLICLPFALLFGKVTINGRDI